MGRTLAVRVLRAGDVTPSRANLLRNSLLAAASDARAFADSSEVKDVAQRQRYRSLADSLRAQVNSLRVEVADVS